MSDLQSENMENLIKSKGEEIFAKMESSNKSIFNKDWWYGNIMDWSMKNEHFKTQMFRFVDVLPYLNNSSEVAKHLKEYFAESGDELPSVFNIGVGVGSLAPALMAGAIRKNVTQMAKMFITGETPNQALTELRKTRKNNMCFTADLLGEATLSEKEGLDYQNRYLELIEQLSQDAQTWTHSPQIDEDERGPIPKVNISVKVTALYSQIKEAAWEDSIEKLKERLRPIFKQAISKQVFVNIDMEQYSHKDLTLDLFKELLLEPEFKDYPHFGIVIQAYLRDSLKDVKELSEFAKKRGVPFTIRLVKGAYWDYETILASQRDWPIPVYTVKAESDKNYEDCARYIIENHEFIRLAIGSHNVRSIAACLVMAEEMGLDKRAVEVQMLYGMAEPIKNSLISQGYRLREYATIGELIPGMAYLVRRLLENTSNESFLRSKFADNVSTENLLKNPNEGLEPSSAEIEKQPGLFYNEPLLDFALPQNREQMLTALTKVKKQLGQTHNIVINNKKVKTDHFIERHNPSHESELVGKITAANKEITDKAVEAAKKAHTKWKRTPASERAKVFNKLAELFARDRFELSALEVYEVGKTWAEADGDICEAIDFCRYYADEIENLNKPARVGHAKGETSHYHYQSRGVALVIAPWNFPLAILTGMVAGAALTGNTVVMKPAEQSSVIAAKLMQLLMEAGCPEGVVNFLPGYGEDIGEHLTSHKDIDLIAFTGSREVGLRIVQKTGEFHPEQRYVKRCIIEMGGKNAIIIDSDADLDEAVAGVIYSAFGFQGQKCSACSRVIVLDSIYDRFVERLKEAAASIEVLHAENPQAYLGPVVDKESKNKIIAMIERAKERCSLAYQSEIPSDGHFVPVTIFTDVDPQAEIAQQEIFGPVLAVIKAKNIDSALDIANDTDYGLTGGIYSRSPVNIDKAKEEFNVGNFYINRTITGAMVDRHPFGGFKMSGLGSKTGGQDYLKQFTDPRVITENTMRRGFAPEEE